MTPDARAGNDDDDAAHFEVSPRDTGWQWVLYGGDGMLAYSLEPYATVNETFGAIDRLWSALSMELYAGDVGFETTEQDGQWVWRLIGGELDSGVTLVISAAPSETQKQAMSEINRFKDIAPRASVRIARSAEEQPTTDSFDVGRRGSPLRALTSLSGRGKRHRRALQQADIQIAVSGIRGKSSTTKRLDDIFNRRGYDTLTKITGDRPMLLRNGKIVPIQRHHPRITLYENIEFFQRLGPSLYENPPADVAIVENQAITEYTMRMVNERFLDPDVVVLCNVRQDHTDTLGADRQRIARAFGRSVPSGAHVVSGEQHPVIHEYLREEVEKRGATISQVDIPDQHRGLVSAETVHALNEVLNALDQPTLSDAQLGGYLASAQPTWSIIDDTRVFNASKTNDIESTEAVRRALVDDEYVLPFVYLRGDRRGRTASFAEYLNILADRDCIDRAHISGDYQRAFADAVDVPCETHPTDADANAVFDELLAEGQPIIFMGNTVAPFMREMERVLAARAADFDAESDLESAGPEAVVDELRDTLATSESEANDVTAALRPSKADRGKFEVYEDKAGEYRWRFRDTDDTIRADSGEGYERHGGVVAAVGRFRTQAMTVNVEVYEDRAGEHRWRARSKNGRIIADGTRGYDDRDGANRAVETVRRLATGASVIEVDEDAARAGDEHSDEVALD